jgi:hypothetical protein
MGVPSPKRIELIEGRRGEHLIDVSVAIGAPISGAIVLDVAVRNASGRSISVANAYAGLTYHLIHATGTPVQVTPPPSRAKVRVDRDPAQRARYLGIASARVDESPLDLDEFIPSVATTLHENGELSLMLAIAASIDPVDRTLIDEVPAGSYQLVVALTTVVTADGARHPTRFRTAEDLTVSVE